jgi:hypothetical protein
MQKYAIPCKCKPLTSGEKLRYLWIGVTAFFDMPASSTASLPTQTGKQPLYWYDPLSQTLTLKRAAQAELYTLEGRLVHTLRGEGPHPVGHISGVYLLRLYPEGAAPVTVRVWLY